MLLNLLTDPLKLWELKIHGNRGDHIAEVAVLLCEWLQEEHVHIDIVSTSLSCPNAV
jgi:hypothetical protein